MSKALPAPQPDLFFGQPLKDATSFRSDREVMSLPFFTLAKRPRKTGWERSWVDEGGRQVFIRNSPGEDGCPTMWDQDILSYIQTLIVGRMNRGEPVAKRIQFSVHDCLTAIRRSAGGSDYQSFLLSLKRLKGTTVYTNVESADTVSDGGFGWLQTFKIVRDKASNRMMSCEIELCDWLFNAMVQDQRYLQFDAEYFALDSGLERKLYQIIRRHLGNMSGWHVGLDKLYVKTGSDSEQKRFNYEIRQIVERDPFPAWALYLSTDSRGPQFGGGIVRPIPQKRQPVYLYVYKRSAMPLRTVPQSPKSVSHALK